MNSKANSQFLLTFPFPFPHRLSLFLGPKLFSDPSFSYKLQFRKQCNNCPSSHHQCFCFRSQLGRPSKRVCCVCLLLINLTKVTLHLQSSSYFSVFFITPWSPNLTVLCLLTLDHLTKDDQVNPPFTSILTLDQSDQESPLLSKILLLMIFISGLWINVICNHQLWFNIHSRKKMKSFVWQIWLGGSVNLGSELWKLSRPSRKLKF